MTDTTVVDVDCELQQYIATALWSEAIGDDFAAAWARKTGEDAPAGDVSLESFGFTADDLAPETLAAMRADVESFVAGADALALGFWEAELGAGQIGHDLWLTRNGHGAGFWDRFTRGAGEAFGRYLTEMARPLGESNLYVGDDGRLYVS